MIFLNYDVTILIYYYIVKSSHQYIIILLHHFTIFQQGAVREFQQATPPQSHLTWARARAGFTRITGGAAMTPARAQPSRAPAEHVDPAQAQAQAHLR